MICYINSQRLLNVRRKRETITVLQITELLKDPTIRAMIEFRKRLREAGKRHKRREMEDFNVYWDDED